MLDPEYLWYVAEPVVDIWEELNMWAIRDIAERIMSAELYDYDKLPGTARWRAWLLNQSGVHYEELQKKLSSITDKSEDELRRLFVEAGLQTLASDKNVFEKHDIEVPALANDKRLTQILNSAYRQTNGELHNFSRTTANASNKLFIDTADKAYFDVTLGNRSVAETVKEAVETVAKNGIYVTYPSGHKDTVETAVRRAVQTGINQGASKISLENCKKLGAEYVVVTAHMGARVSDDNPVANHMGWQGKVYKIEGSTDRYGNLEACTGFPKNPLGLCGYNCRHNFYPYFLGDENPYEDIAKKVDENREIYELNQKQRYMERNIRAVKRKLQGLSAAIDNCKDDKTKFELQEEYNKTSEVLRAKNKAYNTFCKEHADKGIRKKSDRVTIAGWSKEYATRAVKDSSLSNTTQNVVANVMENDTIKYNLQLFANKMPDEKFTQYALNPLKAPDKARAFKQALGYTLDNFIDLKENIYEHLLEDRFIEKGDDGYGMRYEQSLELIGANGKKAKVLTAWIQDGDDKRLVSVYIDK